MNFKTKVSSSCCFVARHSSNIFWKRSFFQCLFENKKCTVFLLSFCHQLSVGALGIKPKTLHPHPKNFGPLQTPKTETVYQNPNGNGGGKSNAVGHQSDESRDFFRIFSTFFLQFGASISCQAPLAQWIVFLGGMKE